MKQLKVNVEHKELRTCRLVFACIFWISDTGQYFKPYKYRSINIYRSSIFKMYNFSVVFLVCKFESTGSLESKRNFNEYLMAHEVVLYDQINTLTGVIAIISDYSNCYTTQTKDCIV